MAQNRRQFVLDLRSAGANDEEIAKALQLADKSGDVEPQDSEPITPTEPPQKAPIIGNPLKGFTSWGKSFVEPSDAPKEEWQFDKGLGPLHSMGKAAEFAGNVLATPIMLPANIAAATLPRAAEAAKQGAKQYISSMPQMTTTASGIPIPMSGGAVESMQKGEPIPTVGEAMQGAEEGAAKWAAENPKKARAIGDIVNISGLPLAGLGGKIAKTAETTLIKSGLKKAGAGKTLQNLGNRIENVTIKIGAPEQRMGAKPEYFSKYNLFGDAGKVQENAMNQIRETASQLKAKIAESAGNLENSLNVLDLLESARLRALESTTFGREKVQREFDNILNDLVGKYGNNLENMDLVDAQELKRAIGKQGDWYEAPMGGKMADDSNIKSQVFNNLYDEFKRGIELKGGPEIKELNTKLSELIPMERAASKRLLVSSRNNPIRLDDYIGGLAVAGSAMSGNYLPALVAGGNVLSKSRGLAGMLSKAGKSIGENQPTKGPLSSLGRTLKSERGSIGVENPQVHTESFKKWFGDWDKNPEQASKVVDESGKPLVVYHGTNSNFNVVNPKKGAQGVFWFTSDPATIKSGMSGAQGTKNIKELFADIKKPAGWTEYNKYSIDELERMGYDGVILPNKKGGFDGFVLNGNQVKSATKNTGSFSSATNDIRGSTALKMLGGTAAVSGGTLAGLGAYQAGKNRKK